MESAMIILTLAFFVLGAAGWVWLISNTWKTKEDGIVMRSVLTILSIGVFIGWLAMGTDIVLDMAGKETVVEPYLQSLLG